MHTHGVESREIPLGLERMKKQKLDILDVTIKVTVYKENQNYFINDMALKKKRK